MKSAENKKLTDAGINIVNEVFIFDVEGVLTAPFSRRVDKIILEKIFQKMLDGFPVILNTGRSISWLQERMFSKLYSPNLLSNNSALKNLLFVGEKGAIWVELSIKGFLNLKINKDKSIFIPEKIKQKVRNLVMNKYSNTMFYDETKLTMISVEMNYNQYFSSQLNNMNTFKNAQKKLVTDLNSIIKDEKLNNILKVVATTIATDIENIKVGKNLGAQRAVDWLKKRNIFPKKYITFGDSNSDFAMADHLNKIGVNVEHVHVGKETDIPQKLPYNLIVTTSKYNDGVKEYLRNF